jgi:hypothetical protein
MSLTKVTYSMIEDAPFNVINYGADSTGVADSTTAIQAAIAAAAASNGGTVYVPPGTYKITATLTINSSSVVIVGAGSAGETNSGGVGSTSATIFKWAGAVDGVMVSFLTPAGVSNSKRFNQGLQGVELDGDGIAGTGIKIKSVNGLQLTSLFIVNMKLYGIYADCYEAGEILSAPDNQVMRWANITIWFLNGTNTTSAVCVFLGGSPAIIVGGNTSGNYFVNCRFVANGQSAMILDNADNNDFMRCSCITTGSTNYALQIRGNGACGANHFYNFGAAPAAYGIRLLGTVSGYPENTERNSFWMADNLNGTQPPVADAGCQYTYVPDNGYAQFPAFVKGAFGNDSTTAIQAYEDIGTATLYVVSGSDNNLRLVTGTNEWSIRVINSTGNLSIEQIAGTGMLVLPAASGTGVQFAGTSGISVGANDSAGVGFRLLRVTN